MNITTRKEHANMIDKKLFKKQDFTPQVKEEPVPGWYVVKLTFIRSKEDIVARAEEKGYELPPQIPTATVTFEIIEGKFAGVEQRWNLKLDGSFTGTQQANSRDLLNDFLDSVDKEDLLECEGLVCKVKLKQYVLENKRTGKMLKGVCVDRFKKHVPDFTLQSDADFLKGESNG